MDGDDGRVQLGPVTVPAAALRWRFSRSQGAGGQHVNTSDTRVELVLDLDAAGLPPAVDARLRARFGDRVRVVASDERSQHRNRRLAFDRLVAQLAAALRRETPRRPTRPGRGAVEERLREKRRTTERKAARRPVRGED